MNESKNEFIYSWIREDDSKSTKAAMAKCPSDRYVFFAEEQVVTFATRELSPPGRGRRMVEM